MTFFSSSCSALSVSSMRLSVSRCSVVLTLPAGCVLLLKHAPIAREQAGGRREVSRFS